MEHEPTNEQHAIFDYVRAGVGDLIVEAGAGCAKTTTIIASLPMMPQRSILLSAFNKRIAEELMAKVPQMPKGHVVHVKTFHALGLSILKAHFKGLEVEPKATEDLINATAGKVPFKVRRAAVRLLRTYKDVQCNKAPEVNAIEEVGFRHNYLAGMPDNQIIETVRVVFDAYLAGQDFTKRTSIDFCDMVWGPIVAGLAPPSRYQAVVVDELQDLSSPQFRLLVSVVAPKGRFIGIGDKMQDVYSFRESLGADAWNMVRDRGNGAMSLPLTMTFRCDRAIVAEANSLDPKLRARPDAGEGSVTKLPMDLLPIVLSKADDRSTFVLSRSNAMLLSCALQLFSHGLAKVTEVVKFSINGGKEIFEPLFTVLEGLQTFGSASLFLGSLAGWYQTESKKAEASNATSRAEQVEEQYMMLTLASRYAVPGKIKRLLETLIGDDSASILLSTVHKVKGLEADRVYLLRETFARYQDRKDRDGRPIPPTQEDLNIELVGITRAKHELVWVTGAT